MADRQIVEPSDEHPITVTPTGRRVTVKLAGDVIAATDEALTLQEASYPAVHYIPLGDVTEGVLSRSDTTTYCPYKGEAAYYHVTAGGKTVEDAVWTYEQPYPAVAQIAGHVAFYPDKAAIALD
ncbi:DUF427 domain-containing protein [Mycolicibacterium sp. F2034L]|uniref:DUF427 domain-containing protein n=1 Tax=Mycolicibacterium sp. F2034L TaxID=2926422 RepID=UPI001FF6478E|nr:DUF427 domain-containing protein [Mycolicibacterium sp. F2034L]MCK0176187.1 DUF427 domain-containing protein [Mycolicibacterium sp. F2034L]